MYLAVYFFSFTVYLPSTADPREEVFQISSLSSESTIKSVRGNITDGTKDKFPLFISRKDKKFSVKTRGDFKYEKAQTWKMVLTVCFEKGRGNTVEP